MKFEHAREVKAGERFAFGKNWGRFLSVLSNERIEIAQESLKTMLRTETLNGKTFLDVGSGSGLFSLAARRLGAKVHSFDFDAESAACTAELKARFFAEDLDWVIEEASILDKDYLSKLGTFDVVYSWGVLHHTGRMYDAFQNIVSLVAPGGALFIAIYNDQGWMSKYWLAVKKTYNTFIVLRFVIVLFHAPYLMCLRYFVRRLTRRAQLERGMAIWNDLIDWLGGYPFEVAKPEDVFRYFRAKKFVLEELRTCYGRMGCNEFVFRKQACLEEPRLEKFHDHTSGAVVECSSNGVVLNEDCNTGQVSRLWWHRAADRLARRKVGSEAPSCDLDFLRRR